MTDPRPRIVVAGESLIDRVIRPDGTVEEHPGGGPFNTARALARLGCRVSFLGGISTDENGRRLRATLEADGVELSLMQTSDRPTLMATATLDDSGAASYTFAPPDSAAAALTEAALPDDTAALHVGTLGLVLEPMATVVASLVARADDDLLVFVDVNARPSAVREERPYRERLDQVLGRADVVKASVADLAWLAPHVVVDDVVARLVERSAIVLVTDGPGAVRIATSRAVETVPVPLVAVTDTVGAGDAFGAGFLAAWTGSEGFRSGHAGMAEVHAATEFAIRVASATVGRAGADPPTLVDLGTPDDPMR